MGAKRDKRDKRGGQQKKAGPARRKA